jgi:hypothetical protein
LSSVDFHRLALRGARRTAGKRGQVIDSPTRLADATKGRAGKGELEISLNIT